MKTILTNVNPRLLAAVFSALVLPVAVPAQPGMMPNGFGGGMSGGYGLDAVKTRIHSTDEEWKVIGPLLQSVLTARQTAESGLSGTQDMGGFGGGWGGFGGGPGGFGGGFGGLGGDSFADPSNRGGFGRGGGPGGGDMFGDPGGRGGRGRGGGGRGGRGGGFGGDNFADPGMGRGGPGGFGPGGFDPAGFGPGGFGPGGPAIAFQIDPATGGPAGSASTTNSAGTTNVVVAVNPGAIGGNNPVALALSELRASISTTNTPAQDIKEKIAAVRGARDKARAEVATAQTRVRLLLTFEQEAVLISLGYLD